MTEEEKKYIIKCNQILESRALTRLERQRLEEIYLSKDQQREINSMERKRIRSDKKFYEKRVPYEWVQDTEVDCYDYIINQRGWGDIGDDPGYDDYSEDSFP